MTSSFKVACSTDCWRAKPNDSASSPPTYEQILAEMSLVGFQGVELTTSLQESLYHDSTLLNARNLHAASALYATRLVKEDFPNERQRLEQHLKWLKTHGVKTILFHEETEAVYKTSRPLSQRPTLERDQWQHLCHGLDSLDAVAKSYEVNAAYLPRIGSIIQSENDIDRLMNMTSSLGLALDTGQLVCAGVNNKRLVERHATRIRHVRLSNVSYATLHEQLSQDVSYPAAVAAGSFTVPGENGPDDTDGLDYLPVIEALLQANYSNWFVIAGQQLPHSGPSITYVRLGFYAVMYLLHKAQRTLAASACSKRQPKEEQLHAPF